MSFANTAEQFDAGDGETAGAIRYALAHWRALTRYVDDGLLEIDNSAAERALPLHRELVSARASL